MNTFITLYVNCLGPYQTLYFAASDLNLRCLRWLKLFPYRKADDKIFGRKFSEKC